MVDTGTYTWDVALLSEAAHNLLRDANYLEVLANRDHPDVQEIPDEFKTEYLQGIDVYGTVLAYRNDVYPAKARAPDQGWKGRLGRGRHPRCPGPAQPPPSTPSRKP